jgi:hypothetical protein
MAFQDGPKASGKLANSEDASIKDPIGEVASSGGGDRKYLFRGDDQYKGGPVGRALGEEADAADIQNFADHVLRKETNRTSRYTSFTEEIKVARRFTSAPDNRNVSKAHLARLRELESRGVIQIWDADRVFDALHGGPKKQLRQAADVRTAMKRNSELLIEGQIPSGVLKQAD